MWTLSRASTHVPTIFPNAEYQLQIHTRLKRRCPLTECQGPIVPTKLPHSVNPLQIHIMLDWRFCTDSLGSNRIANNTVTCRISIRESHRTWRSIYPHSGPVSKVPTIRRRALSRLPNHTPLDGGCAILDRSANVLPTKMIHALYPLHCQTSLDVPFWTDSRTSIHLANNTAPCSISIAHWQ